MKPLAVTLAPSMREPSPWTPTGFTANIRACFPPGNVPSRICTLSSPKIWSRLASVIVGRPCSTGPDGVGEVAVYDDIDVKARNPHVELMVPARVGRRGVAAMEEGAHREQHIPYYGCEIVRTDTRGQLGTCQNAADPTPASGTAGGVPAPARRARGRSARAPRTGRRGPSALPRARFQEPLSRRPGAAAGAGGDRAGRHAVPRARGARARR